MSLFIHFENFKFGVWWIQNRYLLSYTKYSHYSRIIVLSSSLHITVHYYAYFRTGWRFSNHSIVYADYTIYRAAIALLINKVHLMIQILSRLLTRTNFISNEILTKNLFFFNLPTNHFETFILYAVNGSNLCNFYPDYIMSKFKVKQNVMEQETE